MRENSKEDLVLDPEAQKLFDQLGGIDRRERGYGAFGSEGLAFDPLGEEQEIMDLWRIVLADFVHLLAGFLSKVKLHGAKSVRAEDVNPIIDMLTKIHKMSEQNGSIMIRYRGIKSPGEKAESERIDYVVSCEGFIVDMPVIKALANRKGITMSHLPGKLKAAFDRFSSLKIHSVSFDLDKWLQRDRDLMWTSLQGAGQFFGAYKTGTREEGDGKAQEASFQVVYNDLGEADPNLTLLAVANGINASYIQALVQRLHDLMTKPEGKDALASYLSAYDALFAFKNVQQKLKKPPLEINNLRRLIVSDGDEPMTPEKSEVVRMIAQRLGASPQKMAQTIDSVYGRDFSLVSAGNLRTRLTRVSHLLDATENGPLTARTESEVLNSVEKRLGEVRDDVFDRINLDEAEVQKGNGEDRPFGQKLSRKLRSMVGYFKRRVLTKRKIREMIREPIDFDAQDYETIARDLGISVDEAKTFLSLLKGCFGPSGMFIRGSFEKNIPYMAKYGVKVFGFLWYYLKETLGRKDRVAFLNSLQSLISEMQQPGAALRLLLEDFCRKPYEVHFSDRNALILAIVLLRKYNKEIHNDIEVTPEEVLLVRNGLWPEATEAAGDAIDNQADAFFQKIRTIHEKLLAGLRTGKSEGGVSPRFLLSLERESYIFLALLGRPHGHTVLRGAVKTYGNPESEVYRVKGGKGFREANLKQLRVAVRGLSRYEATDDLSLLREVRSLENGFLEVSKDQTYRDSVLTAMEWLDTAIDAISGSGGPV